uniref:Addiction module antitoxin, RelB/DinJ family n=1 Tax=Candidatus Kentrum sp. MB TaxID=2138164 RepID=A0A450XA49_9GAMM|nr:MAG: addiction module antitoxin, RelB/DinJ family [Candidatus Kentron sp. MB]VFK35460.1 MAG: addiction module antitoxin, RelB/DinJ family [Candidatus Kentron sp. MB]VFK77403.1 MAG: addiction module antitoxin, RelB/DinJ family [Candidatus Kentron sp. MB]
MTTIHISLDDALLRRADAVLSDHGLSIQEAALQWLTRIAAGDGLPMEPGQPNKTTINAMREHDEALPSFISVDELMKHLHENH